MLMRPTMRPRCAHDAPTMRSRCAHDALPFPLWSWPHTAGGAGLGESDSLLLSPNIHELRALNRLARLARGHFLCFVQDDSVPPPPTEDTSWLLHPMPLFSRLDSVGSIGESMGLFHVAQHEHATAGGQRPDYHTLHDLPSPGDRTPACSFPATGHLLAQDGEPSVGDTPPPAVLTPSLPFP